MVVEADEKSFANVDHNNSNSQFQFFGSVNNLNCINRLSIILLKKKILRKRWILLK